MTLNTTLNSTNLDTLVLAYSIVVWIFIPKILYQKYLQGIFFVPGIYPGLIRSFGFRTSITI